jgi:hypothetical protein
MRITLVATSTTMIVVVHLLEATEDVAMDDVTLALGLM